MRFEARFPEVFFCRRDCLKCLFLLACLLPPPSGFCHRWPAWPQQWGQARAQAWGEPGLRASRARWAAGGWWPSEGRPAGGFTGGPRQGGAQPRARRPRVLCPAPNLGKASHSEMESWIAHFKAFSPVSAHFTASLSVHLLELLELWLLPVSFPNNLWENMLWIGYVYVFFLWVKMLVFRKFSLYVVAKIIF